MKILDGMNLNWSTLGVMLLGLMLVTGCGDEGADDMAHGDADMTELDGLFEANPSSPAGQNEDQVVARVNETEITQGDLRAEMNMLMGRMQGQVPPEQMAQMQEEMLQGAMENLVIRELLRSEVERKDIEVTDEEVEERVEMLRQQIPPGMTLEEQLAQMDLSVEAFRSNIRMEMAFNKLIEQNVPEVSVSDEEIEAFYEENQEEYFTLPERVEASHILINTTELTTDEELAEARARIEAIREQLVDGADFAELAMAESEGPSSVEGGALGAFARGQMVPPFEEAAFAQEIGEIGEIVETDFGFHIIKVTDRLEPGVQPLDENREQIAEFLGSQTRETALRSYINGLREQATIEFMQQAQ